MTTEAVSPCYILVCTEIKFSRRQRKYYTKRQIGPGVCCSSPLDVSRQCQIVLACSITLRIDQPNSEQVDSWQHKS